MRVEGRGIAIGSVSDPDPRLALTIEAELRRADLLDRDRNRLPLDRLIVLSMTGLM